MGRSLTLLLVCLAACGRAAPPAPRPAPTTTVTVAAPPTTSPELRAVACGFGGVGPVGPPEAPNAWVIALVSVASPGAPLSGVRIAAITLLDRGGGVIARAVTPIALRAAPPGRATSDFSEQGTTPFAGDVAQEATVLLRAHAALDARLETLWKVSAEARARIEMVDATGRRSMVECAAHLWPTG